MIDDFFRDIQLDGKFLIGGDFEKILLLNLFGRDVSFKYSYDYT